MTSFPPSPSFSSPFPFSPPKPRIFWDTGLTALVSFTMVMTLAIVGCGNCRKRVKIAPQIWDVDSPAMERFFREMAEEKPVRFTAQQLVALTDNYSIVLGNGGYGKVYQGQFPNGVKVAVKVLHRVQGVDLKSIEEQFMAEVGTIGRVHHINLVRLYGFCYDKSMGALVYEFMENGSLDKHLFRSRELEWENLYEIAIGTAKGVAYLHEECQQRIIHYDIKPGNVLLDSNFTPKVADFGLAKLCDRNDSHVSVSGYRGTPGYLAPEFVLKNFPITYKCDVYSFGILLFEIFGRRKNAKFGAMGSNESLDWYPKKVWDKYEKGELLGLMEESGIEEKDRSKAERAAMVALWCVQDSPMERPPMSGVVRMLEGGVQIMAPPKPFYYLFSIGMSASGMKPSSDISHNDSSCSHWFKDTTPIMAKYEISVATCN